MQSIAMLCGLDFQIFQRNGVIWALVWDTESLDKLYEQKAVSIESARSLLGSWLQAALLNPELLKNAREVAREVSW